LLAKDWGRGEGRAQLSGVDQIDPEGAVVRRLFDGRTLCGSAEVAPSAVELDREVGEVRRLRVRFVTPTELKHGQQVTRPPEFGILMARVYAHPSCGC
jgi:hypothetical protein